MNGQRRRLSRQSDANPSVRELQRSIWTQHIIAHCLSGLANPLLKVLTLALAFLILRSPRPRFHSQHMTDKGRPYIDASVQFSRHFPFLQRHIRVLKSHDHTSTSKTRVYKPAQEVEGKRDKNRTVADAKSGSLYPRYYRSSLSRPLCWFVSACRRRRRGSRTST